MTKTPTVRFDEKLAIPIFPRPELKTAALVKIPTTKDGSEIPVFIEPEWGGVQVFYGSYYAIIKDGRVIYGSAYEQWINMHTRVSDSLWVKTTIPTAYRARETCHILTLIPKADGNVEEASFELSPGDWIVRQPGGEVQHVKATKYADIYFSQEEARALGLNVMTANAFKQWALTQARSVMNISS